MSEVTKRKISENNKKFSICKICKKQCRGFRGLVDHMHRDHEDYKPWKCHVCDVRTAFVKTLYRHLKQVHGANGSPCPVCGKIFTRAQSMLHHVNKVRQEVRAWLTRIFQHDSEGREEMKCGECGERVPSKVGVCGVCVPGDQAQYTRQVDNNFPIPTSEQDYNFLLYTETALSITDDVNVLRLPFLNQDQKLFEDNQTVTEGFVDSSMFDKNFLVEDIQNTETFNNSRINQVSENTQRELSTSVNHHQIDGTVIRFCKSS